MRIAASQFLSLLVVVLLPLYTSRPVQETNAQRLARGLPPLAPRRRFDPTKVASECEKNTTLLLNIPVFSIGG